MAFTVGEAINAGFVALNVDPVSASTQGGSDLVQYLILPAIQSQFSLRMPVFILKHVDLKASRSNTINPVLSSQGLPLRFIFDVPSDAEKLIGWTSLPFATPLNYLPATAQGDQYKMQLECIFNRQEGTLASYYPNLIIRYVPIITSTTVLNDSWYVFVKDISALEYAKQKGLNDAISTLMQNISMSEKNLKVHEQLHYGLPFRINQLNRLDIKG